MFTISHHDFTTAENEPLKVIMKQVTKRILICQQHLLLKVNDYKSIKDSVTYQKQLSHTIYCQSSVSFDNKFQQYQYKIKRIYVSSIFAYQ